MRKAARTLAAYCSLRGHQAHRGAGLTPRLAVVSAAGPVDRGTGRLVQLPDEPFLLGALDPAAVLAGHVDGPVVVDNDVNWAALAERDSTSTPGLDDFGYVFLGQGLGSAIISAGRVIRGQAGLAGEVAHLMTAGPDGQAMRLIEVFGALGLRQEGSTAIDADRLLSAATGAEPRAAATRQAVGQAVGGVLAAVVALADPARIIIGGSWGSHPVILTAIAAAAARLPRTVPVQAAQVTAEPALAGARSDALSRLRTGIVAAGQRRRPAQDS